MALNWQPVTGNILDQLYLVLTAFEAPTLTAVPVNGNLTGSNRGQRTIISNARLVRVKMLADLKRVARESCFVTREGSMARKPRFTIPGVPQHIVQRGNNREPCFFAPQDHRFYLDCLREASEKFGCAIHAYVLMTNHVHLLLTPEQEGAIGQCLQSVGRRYVRYVNHTYRRTGTLWEGRYKASLIETESYLLTCYRYIELNPVRAAMVAHPGEYRWSSHAHNAAGTADAILTPHPEYLRLGATPETRQHAYRELFRNHLGENLVHTLRAALNQEQVLGSEQFKDKIEATLNRRVRPGNAGRPRKDGVEEEAGEYIAY